MIAPDESAIIPLPSHFIHDVKIPLRNGKHVIHRWTFPKSCMDNLAIIAGEFGLSVPAFLDGFTLRTLPGQRRRFKMPKIKITLEGGDVETVKMMARKAGGGLQCYLRDTVEQTIRNDLTEILWHPKTGRPIMYRCELHQALRVIESEFGDALNA